MKTFMFILVLILITGTMTFARNNVDLSIRSNKEAETQIGTSFGKMSNARNEVIKAIDEIKDQGKQTQYKHFFAENEKAWEKLVETSTMLHQPLKDNTTKPDIRYKRILYSNYSEFRINQYREFVIWIKQNNED